jgi:hypothetical protein
MPPDAIRYCMRRRMDMFDRAVGHP